MAKEQVNTVSLQSWRTEGDIHILLLSIIIIPSSWEVEEKRMLSQSSKWPDTSQNFADFLFFNFFIIFIFLGFKFAFQIQLKVI